MSAVMLITVQLRDQREIRQNSMLIFVQKRMNGSFIPQNSFIEWTLLEFERKVGLNLASAYINAL